LGHDPVRIGQWEIHPAANLFPLMDGADFDAFVEDIREHGLHESIWRAWVPDPTAPKTRKQVVLDGRNRLRACIALRIRPTFRDYEGDDPNAFAISLNLHRRHLTPSQRAAIAADLEPVFAEAAKAWPIAAAEGHPSGKEVEPVPPPGKARDHAAAAVGGVTGRSVSKAKKVRDAAPELHAAVKAGTLAVTTAERMLGVPEATRTEVLRRVKAGESKSAGAALREVTRAARPPATAPSGPPPKDPTVLRADEAIDRAFSVTRAREDLERVLEAWLRRIREARGPAPFVKWVGGKRALLPQLDALLPPGVDEMRHVEPFIGGGAMFFHRRPKEALIGDANPSLVSTYIAVRNHLDELVELLELLAEDYAADATGGQESFRELRALYNRMGHATRVERAAMFIYLNKTCFNGLHRVNRKGKFNTPWGKYQSPKILDMPTLQRASEALQNTTILHADFIDMISHAHAGDFVYLDPPYVPISETASFTSYAEGDFGESDQIRLRRAFIEADKRGCKLMLSNSDAPLVHELYAGFNIQHVWVPRAVNSDAEGRDRVREVVVRNYGGATC
jgi:DNA adenine methylase